MLNAGNAIAATIDRRLLGACSEAISVGAAHSFRSFRWLLLALAWQWSSLPALPPRESEGPSNVFRLLLRPPVAIGMVSVMLLFMGQFALFTYLRPFLETVTSVSISTPLLLLLLMGLGGGRWDHHRQPSASK